MKHKIMATLLLCGLLTGGNAQQPRVLQLTEALELSVKNNKQLQLRKAQIEEATAAVQEAKEKKLPSASISGAYMLLGNANIDMAQKQGQSGNPSQEAPSPNQAMYGMFNVSQPLYAGGKIKYGILSAQYLQKATTLDAENNLEEVLINTMESFSNLYKANTAVMLVKENLQQSRQRVKDFTAMEANGLLPRNDLLKAQLQMSNVELSLLDAENNWAMANLNMNLLLGLPTGTILQPDTTGVEKRIDDRTLEQFTQLALSGRKDKAALGNRIDAALIAVKAVKADKIPTVSLTGGYVAAHIPDVISVTNAVNIGVGVSYNIASLWKTAAREKQARSRVQQLQLNESILNDKIVQQVNQRYLSLLSQRKKIDVMQKANEQATENYRIVQNKFNNQLATTTELLEADVARLQASLAYTLARADAFVAYHQLLLSTGNLSQTLNISAK